MQIATAAERFGFAPDEPSFVADPYPAYAELRWSAPVVYDPATDHWLVSRHADVNALLRDRRFGRTYLHLTSHREMGHPEDLAGSDAFWHLIRNGILDMETPDHTRVRRLVAKAFTPRTVAELRPTSMELVEEPRWKPNCIIRGLQELGSNSEEHRPQSPAPRSRASRSAARNRST